MGELLGLLGVAAMVGVWAWLRIRHNVRTARALVAQAALTPDSSALPDDAPTVDLTEVVVAAGVADLDRDLADLELLDREALDMSPIQRMYEVRHIGGLFNYDPYLDPPVIPGRES